MYTTIKVSTSLKSLLDRMKMFPSETYENVIQDLIEDHLTVRPEVLKSIKKGIEEAQAGKTVSLAEMKARIRKG